LLQSLPQTVSFKLNIGGLMDTRLALIKDGGNNSGVVKPVRFDKSGGIDYGISVGTWRLSPDDNNIYVTLYEDIDTIKHEVATRKSVRTELRAAEKDRNGTEVPMRITFDPVTRRFKQVRA
jgi:hypothetical protein